jgi:hypothetical protein
MSKLKGSAARKARRQSYQIEGRYSKNKIRKIERHLKNHPVDGQAKKALDKVGVYSRKRPHTKVPKWHVVTKKTAKGKTYSLKELTRPAKVRASAYVNGIAVIEVRDKTAFELALGK